MFRPVLLQPETSSARLCTRIGSHGRSGSGSRRQRPHAVPLFAPDGHIRSWLRTRPAGGLSQMAAQLSRSLMAIQISPHPSALLRSGPYPARSCLAGSCCSSRGRAARKPHTVPSARGYGPCRAWDVRTVMMITCIHGSSGKLRHGRRRLAEGFGTRPSGGAPAGSVPGPQVTIGQLRAVWVAHK